MQINPYVDVTTVLMIRFVKPNIKLGSYSFSSLFGILLILPHSRAKMEERAASQSQLARLKSSNVLGNLFPLMGLFFIPIPYF